MYRHCTIYLGSATTPQPGHFLRSAFSCQFRMSGLSCVPRSVTWNTSSRIIDGLSCFPERQYHRNRSGCSRYLVFTSCLEGTSAPCDASGRTRSITMPTVLVNRTGLCGVLAAGMHTLERPEQQAARISAPGNKNISPSSISMSRNSPSSTTRKSILPLCW